MACGQPVLLVELYGAGQFSAYGAVPRPGRTGATGEIPADLCRATGVRGGSAVLREQACRSAGPCSELQFPLNAAGTPFPQMTCSSSGAGMWFLAGNHTVTAVGCSMVTATTASDVIVLNIR